MVTVGCRSDNVPVKVDATRAPDIVRFLFEDPWPSAGEFGRLRSSLIVDGRLSPGTAVLFDLSRLSQMPSLPAAELERCSARPSPLLPRRRAYLAVSALQQTFAQELQSSGPHDLDSRIFVNEADAMRWLADGSSA